MSADEWSDTARSKFIPKVDEKNVKEFLIAFEKIYQKNNWSEDKYAAILQPSLIDKYI